MDQRRHLTMQADLQDAADEDAVRAVEEVGVGGAGQAGLRVLKIGHALNAVAPCAGPETLGPRHAAPATLGQIARMLTQNGARPCIAAKIAAVLLTQTNREGGSKLNPLTAVAAMASGRPCQRVVMIATELAKRRSARLTSSGVGAPSSMAAISVSEFMALERDGYAQIIQ
jgi:hypothetical protein